MSHERRRDRSPAGRPTKSVRRPARSVSAVAGEVRSAAARARSAATGDCVRRRACARRPVAVLAARSRAAAAMIRPRSAAGGSTRSTDSRSAGTTEPSSANSGMWLRTGGEVPTDRLGLIGLEGPEHERGREVADVVAGHAPPSMPELSRRIPAGIPSPPMSARRIASSPSRIRLLTVPSGVSVRTAISCWVSPPK